MFLLSLSSRGDAAGEYNSGDDYRKIKCQLFSTSKDTHCKKTHTLRKKAEPQLSQNMYFIQAVLCQINMSSKACHYNEIQIRINGLLYPNIIINVIKYYYAPHIV